jgi:MFS family permease
MTEAPLPNTPTDGTSESPSSAMIAAGVAAGVLTLALIVGAVLLAVFADRTGPTVEVVRDVVIILLAFELFVIGAALIVFVIQAARLANLLNNEVQPIVQSTKETVNVVRGTAVFISRHLVQPVIYAAGLMGTIRGVLKDASRIAGAAGMHFWPFSAWSEPSAADSGSEAASEEPKS